MLTSIIGYPRIGKSRELKFALEKYFRNEIPEKELLDTARQIRLSQWILQKETGLDFIPSNDFSLYDNMLDTAILLNVIPDRYKDLNLSQTDMYFAMARGYQGKNGDVKALAMKKWFNTNYHYMVPEIDDNTKIQLTGTKPFDEFVEAKSNGISTKPVIIGAFTFLKLLRYTGNKTAEDFITDIINAYTGIIEKFNNAGAEWIQLDEPYLVHDISDKDIELFKKIYNPLLSSKGNIKILLQTYFGDIRDCYQEIADMDFDGIGLDFSEGIKTAELIEKYGFPKDKALFAGVVNGKNIHRNNYEKTLDTLMFLREKTDKIVINTSCSLLHVPYTLNSEIKIDEKFKRHFAFAEEKLNELSELKILSECDYKNSDIYNENKNLSKNAPERTNPSVQQRMSKIKDSDFIRMPEFAEREKIQKAIFKLPLFPTTTIGSFPQTKDVKEIRKSFKNHEISTEEYDNFIKDKIKHCINIQEEIGLDVLVHGEYERNDMVEYFGEQLSGFIFTEKGWVQSYGTRCVKPPIIWGDISRNTQMTVRWSKYAQSLTDKYVKGMLTGPVTILNWSFPREDISLEETAYQIALAIRDEVLDLEAGGIKIIQVDEAALREKLPLRKSDWYSQYLNWAIPAFRLVHSGVKPETQIHTHMCYSEFTDIIKSIDNMDADVITFEASRSDLTILNSLSENKFKTEVGPGVYDIHSPRIPPVEEIKATFNKMIKKIEPQKLWINPDCGLKTRGEAETIASLKNMVTAAKELRNENY